MAPLPRVFIDFSVADKPLGRVVVSWLTSFGNGADARLNSSWIEFRRRPKSEKGLSRASGLPLSYKGSPVHRVIEGFMIQGGDFTKRNGTGGESIYGGMFADERLEGEGTEVNRSGGPNTNGSQYFITLAPAPHLTGKHVVFGRVVNGFEHIATIGKLPTDDRDRPYSGVTIAHCGELELRRPAAAAAPPKRAASISPPPRRRSPSRSISPNRSRSRSPPARRREASADDSEEERRQERRARKAERRQEKDLRRKEKKEKREKGKREHKETEEELDERLEREENERLEKAKLENEDTTRRRKEEERRRAEESGGVVYKGRGAMRYLDPETRFTRNVPTNYDNRQTPVYSNRRRGPPHNGAGNGEGADSGRWVKGVDARPVFNREKRDEGLDKYKTRGEGERRDRNADDWRFGARRERGERGERGEEGARGDREREERADRWAKETRRSPDREQRRSKSRSRSRSRSPPGRALSRSRSPPARRGRSPSPPRMRSASPLRGDRDRDDESGSDMVMEDD